MDAKIYIAIPCHNRRAIAERCIPTVRAGMGRDDILACYNDGSSEYGAEFLYGLGASTVHDLSLSIGIEAQRRQHFERFVFWGQKFGWTHLYLTDADAPHDVDWRKQGLRLQEIHHRPVCLYNTEAHARIMGNTITDDPASEIIVRQVAPGISYLLTMEHAKAVVTALQSISVVHWNWDWTVPAILGYHFAVSRISYCDHIGKGGYHHPAGEGYEGGDRALNPTPYLANKRSEIVRELEAL